MVQFSRLQFLFFRLSFTLVPQSSYLNSDLARSCLWIHAPISGFMDFQIPRVKVLANQHHLSSSHICYVPDTLILFQAALHVQPELMSISWAVHSLKNIFNILILSKYKPHNVKLNKFLLIDVKYMSAIKRLRIIV